MKNTDAQIATIFRKSYIYRIFLRKDDFRAEVADGVVTLSGTVAEEAHKQLAQETLCHITGVTQVINHLATLTERADEQSLGSKVARQMFMA